MRKAHTLKLYELTTAELQSAPWSSRLWKRRDIIRNSDTGEVRFGDGLNNYGGLAAQGVLVNLSTATVATVNVTIATGLNAGDIVSGYTLAAGNLVLLTAQTDPAENGIYVAGVTPARHSDYATYDSMPGIIVKNAAIGGYYRCVSDQGGTLGTTGLVFVQVAPGNLDLTVPGPKGGIPQAAPALGDKFLYYDISDGNMLKWCTGTQLKAALA